MQIIGLGHYKQTGKDTFARMIVEACHEIDPSFRIGARSFAYKLKQICQELYGWAGLREPEYYETDEGRAVKEEILPEIGKSPRQIWIDMGTKGVRNQVYVNTWRDYLLNTESDLDAMVITDVRFKDEVDGIKERGGVNYLMERVGFGPGPDEADQALADYDGWDGTFRFISGDLEAMMGKAYLVAKRLTNSNPHGTVYVRRGGFIVNPNMVAIFTASAEEFMRYGDE